MILSASVRKRRVASSSLKASTSPRRAASICSSVAPANRRLAAWASVQYGHWLRADTHVAIPSFVDRGRRPAANIER